MKRIRRDYKHKKISDKRQRVNLLSQYEPSNARYCHLTDTESGIAFFWETQKCIVCHAFKSALRKRFTQAPAMHAPAFHFARLPLRSSHK